MALKWEDPPKRKGGVVSKKLVVLAELRENPNQWALVQENIDPNIIWDKMVVRRGDRNYVHTRRPGLQTERILVFSKTPNYYHSMSGVEERGDVWHVLPRPQVKDAAAFPDELVARCIDQGCPPGGLICDPFAGSGTTGRVARSMGRKCRMFDLYPSNDNKES
jgi:DNA modification methylase